MAKKTIIEMTPFVYEDGNIYYFQIDSKSSTYHGLYVYKKVTKEYKKFFRKFRKDEYICLNPDDEKLINVKLELNDVKKTIKEVLIAYNTTSIKGWDGIVGNVPEDIKKSFIRDSKLKNILDEDEDEDDLTGLGWIK